MSSHNCLRIARRCPNALHGSRSSVKSLHSLPGYTLTIERTKPSASSPTTTLIGASHSGNLRLYSRFKDGSHVSQSSAGYSEFKKQRKTQLREDQESSEPLWNESYPRMSDPLKVVSVPEFIETFENQTLTGDLRDVTIAGRIRSKRVMGKVIFLDIVNEFRKVQVMVSKGKTGAPEAGRSLRFDLLKNLIQVGDHVSVTGIPTRTKSGELTLDARELPQLISPTMEQIPDKLIDQQARMQDRHVDMLVNRETIDVLRLRSEITRYMRDHLHSKRFLEFQTPIMAENAGGAIARPFVTRASEFPHKDLAMRVAPELWLKRLVIGGVDKVFEIGPSFRNEGIDSTHNPEFTTCEFYSAYTNLSDLINETEELIYGMAKHCQEVISTQLTALPPIDLSRYSRPFTQIEFVPGLEAALGIRLPKLSSDDALPELIAVLKLAGIQIPGGTPETLEKLLDKLAAMYLEPKSFNEPIFITHHPACMSPLAKSFICPKTYQLISARAELFIGARELANMYEEENDPDEQQRKLTTHQNLVNKPDGTIGTREPPVKTEEEMIEEEDESAVDEGGEAPPLDQNYIRALDYGLPPTGGWGCGMERLVMLFSGANRISDCLSFGTLQNVVGLSSTNSAGEKK